MSTMRTLEKLNRVWNNAGENDHADEAISNTAADDKTITATSARSMRTSRLDLRITRDEKQRIELLAVRERIALNALFTRMLAHYERTYGRVEIATHTDETEA